MVFDDFVHAVQHELLHDLVVNSANPHDPVEIHRLPPPWVCVGTGNYCAVVAHPDWPEWVVKVYAQGRPGLAGEAAVYQQLGAHPAYSECRFVGEGFLILRRLVGTTLYDCLRRGIAIPPQVIGDIDAALAYARQRGLHPTDVHAKNVMMTPDGHGLVVDISDFGTEHPDRKWSDLKRAYERLYLPLIYRHPVPVPHWLLTVVRKGYRLYRRLSRSLGGERRLST